jgi:hypothetical protein
VTDPVTASEPDPQDDEPPAPRPDRARALGEVQRQAGEDASQVIGQLLAAVDRSPPGRGRWWRPPGLDGAGDGDANGVGVGPGDGGGWAAAPLVLEAAGGVAHGTVWLHNTTDVTVGPDRFTVTALTSHDGVVVPAAGVEVVPSVLPPLPPQGSLPAVVRVEVGGVPPGRYVGHLLTARAALALHVVVPA